MDEEDFSLEVCVILLSPGVIEIPIAGIVSTNDGTAQGVILYVNSDIKLQSCDDS